MHHKISRKRSEQGWSEHDTDRHRKMTAEYRSLCKRLRDRIAESGLPPDEAYWWTRIALREAALLEHTPAARRLLARA